MTEQFKSFATAASGLSRSPLGIIALFIVLIYGFASLVTMFASSLQAGERTPLIYFLVLFPVAVLLVFAWLVSRHANKLYSPGEFKNEDNFVTVVAALAAATTAHPKKVMAEPAFNLDAIAEGVRAIAAQTSAIATLRKRSILWVDDKPERNTYERRAFEGIGLECELALSTEEAASLLKRRHFAAVISDMKRKEGEFEGTKLLALLREGDSRTPFFIYSLSDPASFTKEVARLGGQGVTSDARELFQMVVSRVLGEHQLEQLKARFGLNWAV